MVPLGPDDFRRFLLPRIGIDEASSVSGGSAQSSMSFFDGTMPSSVKPLASPSSSDPDSCGADGGCRGGGSGGNDETIRLRVRFAKLSNFGMGYCRHT